ncbi:MAG: SCP2 sterol-binding domain-containing protein [Gammaproteobacteria bacterium]|nr:SCP2 sterol-binding domain-containing protein [Gammaproteobacteria bacterium]
MSLPQVFIASLESAFNQYLSLDPAALDQLAEMEGKIIAIDISGIGESLYLFPGIDGIMVLGDFDGEADTRLNGTPLALAKLSLSKNAAPVLFSGEVIISGDTRLGHSFKKILSQIDIDWEEQLSLYVGDVVAHQLANVTREFSNWFSRSQRSVQLDIGEYLQEEQHFSPARAEVDRFINNVDEIRNAVDRLQARVNRLTNKTS